MNNEADRQKPNLDYENLITMSNADRLASQMHNVNHNTKKIELKRGLFKIAHLNIRSVLVKNIDQLRIYLQKQQFDVVSINKMLDDTIADHEISITGYDIIRNDRSGNGGGVAIYIRSIGMPSRHELEDDNLETITVEISKPESKPFFINTWYRPPGTLSTVFSNF